MKQRTFKPGLVGLALMLKNGQRFELWDWEARLEFSKTSFGSATIGVMSKKRNHIIYAPNSFYHVYNRGNHKESIFFNSRDYLWFLQTLERFAKDMDLIVYGYCLMPNHYHLLIKLDQDIMELSDFMHRCMTSYVRYFNLRHKLVGRLFQGPFKVKQLPGINDILKVIKYFEQNPVKAGLVKNSEDYRWLRISLNVKDDINLK